jgi:hypothetical protein
MSKCFHIIDFKFLRETLSYKSSFMLFNYSIWVELRLENPATTFCLFTYGKRHDAQCMIAVKCSKFFLHSLLPYNLRLSFLKCLELMNIWHGNEECSVIWRHLVRFKDWMLDIISYILLSSGRGLTFSVGYSSWSWLIIWNIKNFLHTWF